MFARLRTVNARIAFAALIVSTLLGGCATSGRPETATNTPQAGSSEQFTRLGDRARDRGDLALAASFYRQAYDAQPENVGPLVSLGHVLLEMRAPDKAEEAFQAALLREPRNFEALRGLGNARIEQHNAQQAIPPLEQAMAVAANDFRVLNALGVAYDMTGNHIEAQKHYQSGCRSRPTIPVSAPITACRWRFPAATRRRSKPSSRSPRPLGRRRSSGRPSPLCMVSRAISTEAERIARLDLDEGSVQTNLKRYAAIREAGLTKASAGAPSATPAGNAAVETAPLEEQPQTKVSPQAQPAALTSTEPAVSEPVVITPTEPKAVSAKPTAEVGPARAKAVPLVAPVETEPVAAGSAATNSQADEAMATATSTLSASSSANGQQASAALVDEDAELTGGTAGAADPAPDWAGSARLLRESNRRRGWLARTLGDGARALRPAQAAGPGSGSGGGARPRLPPADRAVQLRGGALLCDRLHEKQIDCVLADF